VPIVLDLWQDAAYALRVLRRQRSFALTAILTLALGIGANNAIFSVVNAVVLRPLKAPEAARLVRFITTTGALSTAVSGAQAFDAWRQQTAVFEDVSAHRLEYVNLTDRAEPEQIPVARVSAEFFHLFRAPILSGRTFTTSEDRPGGNPVAVLSHALWTRQFQGDPGVLGRRISLGNVPHVIVGVVSAGFDTEQFDPQPDVWVPFQLDVRRFDGGNLFTVTGRLKPDATVVAANAQLAVANAVIRRDTPGPRASWTVEPLREAMVGSVRSSLNLLAAAVGFLLLIACVNVSNLLLVRADIRTREMAVRTALGAGRNRILRQLLTESLILSLAGGALGLVAGSIGVRFLLAMYPGNNPFRLGDPTVVIPRIGAGGAAVTIDWRVFTFALAASVVTGLLFGLWPALRVSRVDLVAAMKRTVAGGSGSGSARVRATMVVIEVALALMLVVGAALLIRTSLSLRAVDAGFDPRHVVTMRTSIAATRFETRAGIAELTRTAAEEIRAVPGVVSATAACCMPLETVWQLPFVVSSRPADTLTRAGNLAFTGLAGWTFIAPGYFDVLKIPIIRGRDFTDRDGAGAPGVVIINQEMARRFWPGGDPLNDRLIIGKGMRPEYDQEPLRQIIGIVGNVRDTALTRPPRPAMYVPMGQEPDGVTTLNVRLLPLVWMARTAAAPRGAAASVEKALQRASGLPVTRIRSLEEVVAEATARSRFDTWLMTILGACALLLAVIGVYGLMAYAVQQQTPEIGIRMALGADERRVRNMVLRQGLSVTVVGIAVGVVSSLSLARVIAALLFGVAPRDPVVFTTVPLLLAVAAFVAVWVPARRATRVDPVTALRME